LLNKLSIVGIDLNAITQQLEDAGVEKFIAAYDQLTDSIREKETAVLELHGQ
jgi:transaldolase